MMIESAIQKLTDLLEESISQQSASWFRKSSRLEWVNGPEQVLEHPCLMLRAIQLSQSSQGTFRTRNGMQYDSFRDPGRLVIEFSILRKRSGWKSDVDLYEKLYGYLFNHSRVAPAVPAEFEKYPELYEKLSSESGRLIFEKAEARDQCLAIDLQYEGPYHDGERLDEGRLVEKRKLELFEGRKQ